MKRDLQRPSFPLPAPGDSKDALDLPVFSPFFSLTHVTSVFLFFWLHFSFLHSWIFCCLFFLFRTYLNCIFSLFVLYFAALRCVILYDIFFPCGESWLFLYFIIIIFFSIYVYLCFHMSTRSFMSLKCLLYSSHAYIFVYATFFFSTLNFLLYFPGSSLA